jgi:hypothetical protein
MKFCETKEEYVAWAIELYDEDQARKKGELPKIMDVAFLMDYKEPESVWADGECDYRRGFCHGMAYAVELVDMLKRRGYIRASEISTIIDDFTIHQVYAWRFNAIKAISEKKWREGHPELSNEPWRDLREMVFQRDGYRCVECGSTTDIECDHIESVRGGGMPRMDNLQTLCCRCNRRKGAL